MTAVWQFPPEGGPCWCGYCNGRAGVHGEDAVALYRAKRDLVFGAAQYRAEPRVWVGGGGHFINQIAGTLAAANLAATEEPGRTRYADLGVAGDVAARPPRKTRLRKVTPSLYDLRQAYLGAKSGQAAFDALLAFLAAVDAARSEDELDTLDDDTPARPDPACQVGAMVCVVLGLLSWAALAAGVMAGSLVVLWAVGVPAAVAAWVLGRVVTGRRHRGG